MLSNYVKITLRNIRKHKGYTFINLAGLAVSLACCLLIGLWILGEMSHDKAYPDQDRIQAVLTNDRFCSPNALAPYFEENVPEIQHAARLTWGEEALINSGMHYSFEDLLAALRPTASGSARSGSPPVAAPRRGPRRRPPP